MFCNPNKTLSTMSITPVAGLLKFPEELLDSCVELVLHDMQDKGFEYLKTLPYVCKRFSRLHPIVSKIFHSIRMIADCEFAFSAEELRRSGLARSIRHATFVQPLHAEMEFSDFVEIYDEMFKHGRGPYGEDAQDGRHASTAPGNLDEASVGIHSMIDLSDGYNSYIERARRAYELITDEYALKEL